MEIRQDEQKLEKLLKEEIRKIPRAKIDAQELLWFLTTMPKDRLHPIGCVAGKLIKAMVVTNGLMITDHTRSKNG